MQWLMNRLSSYLKNGALIVATLVVVIFLLLVAYESRHNAALSAMQKTSTDLTYARYDIASGLLHLTLADRPESPWQYSQGLILIKQGLRAYEKATNRISDVPLKARFDDHHTTFKDLLQSNKTIDSSLRFRTTIFRLFNTTSAVEQQILSDFTQMRAKHNQVFMLSISVAIGLLTLMTLLIYRNVKNNLVERRRAQERIRKSEQRWRFALEGNGDGIYDWDVNSDHIQYSDRWEALLGWKPEEQSDVAADWLQFVHPEDLPHVERTLSAFKSGEIDRFEMEHRLKCKNGSWKWLLSRGMATEHNEDGSAKKVLGIFSDIHSRKQDELKIWHQANHDFLTDLPNRRLAHEKILESLEQAKLGHHRLALMFLDIDSFRDINETLSHRIGNMLLVEVANRLKNVLTKDDVISREGGDEFTIAIARFNENVELQYLAQRILSTFEKPFVIDEELIFITASMGITVYPDDGDSVEVLLKNADQALYEAKDAGRNDYAFFTLQMRDKNLRANKLRNELRGALSGNELEIVYHPIVNLPELRPVKAEALLRWHHPELGTVSPVEFIPIAEASGLIIEIGNWIFEQVLEVAQQCRTMNSGFQIGINKSPVQFQNAKDEAHDWARILTDKHIDGSMICVEITESLLLTRHQQVESHIKRLRNAGMSIALDDFGTGYSSLAYLNQYDIDFLKIDKSFVRNLATNNRNVALCSTIIQMAHELDIEVVAEGVEYDSQLNILKELGCDYVQGYYFAKPMSYQDFIAYLEQELTADEE